MIFSICFFVSFPFIYLNASRIPPGQEENVGPRVEMAVGDRIIRDGGSEVVAVVGEGWGLVRAG